MKILVVFAALCSISFAVLLPALSSAKGCPPIHSGEDGVCAFMCGMDGLLNFGSNRCSAGHICCLTACGGTTCIKEHEASVMTFNCFVSPCMFAKCDAHPTAMCKDNYCGGCNADFYENGHKVHC